MPKPATASDLAALRICHLMHGRGDFDTYQLAEMTGYSTTMTRVYMRHIEERGVGQFSVKRSINEVTGLVTWRINKASRSRQSMMHCLATTKPMRLTGGQHD